MADKIKFEKRFWDKVKITGTYDCWEWQGAKNTKGYGEFWNTLRDGRHTRAHQVSWILRNGEIPDGLCICHKCDNPSCVNPAHLFLGTVEENNADTIKKGRRIQGKLLYGRDHPQHGSNAPHSKLTDKDVLEILHIRDTEKISFAKIGSRFGVSAGLVNNIVHGRKWKWLTGR